MFDETLRYIIYHWWTAFLLTLVVEIPIFLLMSRKIAPIWKRSIGAILCSCLSHPLLWHVWRHVFEDYTAYVITGELLVVILETFVFFGVARPIRLRRAAAASLVANGASYGTGLLLYIYLNL